MFDIIRKFVSEFTESEEPKEFIHSRKQLAEAALMYHVIAVDGVVSEDESKRMAEILAKQFDLDEAQTASLAQEAKLADQEAIDLYKFTSQLKYALEEEDRITIVEHLWEMVFADGVLHELEDNVLWRISELLAVDSRDRINMKRKVWKSHNEASEGMS